MRCVRFRMKSFDYKSIALPAELQGHIISCVIFSSKGQINQCKKSQVSSQSVDCSGVRRTNYNNFHHELFRESTVKRNYEYYEVIPKQAKEEINYIIPVERKSREPVYKSTGKFPKIDEAIAAAKKYRDEQ